jgi:hypothetical protein
MHALSKSNNWVIEGETTILQNIPAYQATFVTIWNAIVRLGHSSGRIALVEFKRGSKLIEERYTIDYRSVYEAVIA